MKATQSLSLLQWEFLSLSCTEAFADQVWENVFNKSIPVESTKFSVMLSNGNTIKIYVAWNNCDQNLYSVASTVGKRQRFDYVG